MSKPDSVFVGLVNSENEVFTVRRSSLVKNAGLWALPGGRQDPGESVWKTAGRELFEETGLLLDVELHGYMRLREGKTIVIVVPWTPSPVQNAVLSDCLEGKMVSNEISAARWRTLNHLSCMTGLHKSLDLMYSKWPSSSVNLFDMLENRAL